MPSEETLTTAAAAVLFAAVFLVGGRVNLLGALTGDKRVAISFGAGMSSAYVFVHLMPELHGARLAFAESASGRLPYEGMAIYFLALVGFLVFYGLDHLRAHLRENEPEESEKGFRLHVGGFAAYVWMMAYLLVNNLEETKVSLALYAVAIGVHLLGVDHELRGEYGERYDRSGRFVLAAMAVFGWAAGETFGLPRNALAMLVAFVSGAVIMNASVMELPTEKDGRFVPFLIGGLVYGLILIPLG